jgi:hypothetical protein
MAEIIEMNRACAGAEPISFVGWLMQHLRPRAHRLGNADELPERMRRDMGLAPADPEQRHYHEYFSSRGW